MMRETLTPRPLHKLFASRFPGPASPDPARAAGRKGADRSFPKRAETVLAGTNASVLGYRSNNQSRET